MLRLASKRKSLRKRFNWTGLFAVFLLIFCVLLGVYYPFVDSKIYLAMILIILVYQAFDIEFKWG